VDGAEAEGLKLSCSVGSACGVGRSPVTAIADVRRHVSWDHSGYRGEGNNGTQLCGFVQLSGGTSLMAMAIEQEIRVGMVGSTAHHGKMANSWLCLLTLRTSMTVSHEKTHVASWAKGKAGDLSQHIMRRLVSSMK
jgi:hypothetical protein